MRVVENRDAMVAGRSVRLGRPFRVRYFCYLWGWYDSCRRHGGATASTSPVFILYV